MSAENSYGLSAAGNLHLQHLPAAELLLRCSYEATPAMLHTIDLEGRILLVSDLWLSKLGYRRDEVIGRLITAFLTPESEAYSRTVVLPQFLHTGICRDVEYQMVRKDGQRLDVRISATLERENDGRAARILAVIQDVTVQKRAEQSLETEKRRLAYAIEGAGIATWEWNAQTGEARFDSRWAEMIGLTLHDLQPMSMESWRAYIHPDDLDDALRLRERHLAGESARFECESRMWHRDGRWIWVLDRGAVMTRTADGRPEWMFGTHKDISERKLQEQALRKSELLLKRTSKVAGVGGWELDLATNEVDWSAETYRILGAPSDYLPNLPERLRLYAPHSRPIVEAAIQKAAETGEGYDLELELNRSDGTPGWARSVCEVELHNGKPTRLVGIFQDISNQVAQREALRHSNERLAIATESGNIGIWEWDLGNDRVAWSPIMYQIYGIDPLIERIETSAAWRKLIHPEDLPVTISRWTDALEGKSPYDFEFRVLRPDGAIYHIRSTGRVSRDESGNPSKVIGANWDVTESRRLTAELADNHELLRVTLRSIGDGVITSDGKGQITWLNPTAERMTGWETHDAIGRPLNQVFHIVNEQTRLTVENPVLDCMIRGTVSGLASPTVLLSRDGSEFGIEDSAAPIFNDRGEVLGAVLVFHDVTEQRRLSGEMNYRATHDPLTGLINRAEFEQRLRQTLHRAQIDKSQNCLLYIDLDQFKLVNDSCGHSVGDRLLEQVAKLLTDVVRISDKVARLGGDEFAIILENCLVSAAENLAQKICDLMETFRFLHEEKKFRIGASIGLVPLDDRWSTTAALLQAADISCYAAKDEGRNRVHTWGDTDLKISEKDNETKWATRIEEALDEDKFVLFAQHITRLKDGSANQIDAEILLRMANNDGSLIPPGAFLPAAERFHLAGRIDRWVMARVILWMQSQTLLHRIGCLYVNLSGQSVGDRGFHLWAINKLKEAGPEICQKLCFEITETAVVTSLADAAHFIQQLRGIDVRVALDDFGAGSSSFGYLKNMPVDVLKIDGQFIRDIITDQFDEAAVRCFVDLAKVAKLITVAEFVENQAVLTRLLDLGIDFAQGFHIHRPVPLDQAFGFEAQAASQQITSA